MWEASMCVVLLEGEKKRDVSRRVFLRPFDIRARSSILYAMRWRQMQLREAYARCWALDRPIAKNSTALQVILLVAAHTKGRYTYCHVILMVAESKIFVHGRKPSSS